LLTKILDTNPDTRVSVDDIREHPWFKMVKEKKIYGLFPGKEKMPYNDPIFNLM
jgi:hypothetical protein